MLIECMFAVLHILIGQKQMENKNEIRGVSGAQFKREGVAEEIRVDPPDEDDASHTLSPPLFIRQLRWKEATRFRGKA